MKDEKALDVKHCEARTERLTKWERGDREWSHRLDVRLTEKEDFEVRDGHFPTGVPLTETELCEGFIQSCGSHASATICRLSLLFRTANP